MTDSDYSLSTTLGQMHETLKRYIEATYHISDESLVGKRLALLSEPGVIAQEPYIESTPRYKAGRRIEELGLEPPVVDALLPLTESREGSPRRLFNPLYEHQSQALELSHIHGRSLVVMTGTGSGKTETFMIPIMARLAREAGNPSWSSPAVRALVLYPMNALVNDQVSRLRLLMGDSRYSEQIVERGRRPARFARYTSRTPYPGLRTRKRDSERLKPVAEFYVNLLDDADKPGAVGERATRLITELKARGKWPAKSDFRRWFGSSGSRYQDTRTKAWRRAVTLDEDVELFTRHEVLESPPDVLVTNYSMLEYMMMRPLERSVFDETRAWLARNSDEKFLLVVDEAHLYRGSAGAEVALLLRRLRDRLGISADRMDVICTSASFSDPGKAAAFAAQLSGKAPQDFDAVVGQKQTRAGAARGSALDVAVLNSVALGDLLAATSDSARLAAIDSLLKYRGVEASGAFRPALMAALEEYAPLSLLINATMDAAYSISELSELAFEGVTAAEADSALTILLTLASMAKLNENDVPLFPARAHMFFRGLPGLWACLNPHCPYDADTDNPEHGPVGKLFAQPRDRCDSCGSLVLELFTCRGCGTAYGRGYTDDLDDPRYLWAESGSHFKTSSGEVVESHPLDICLESPSPSRDVQSIELDLLTGQINPEVTDSSARLVFLRSDRTASDPGDSPESLGRFIPCCVCGDSNSGKGSVQDHQTKGDQPFQALVATQVQVQTPGLAPATDFAPLRGRKVLLFSDSRQMAARLAPNIQSFSYRDALRPMMLVGLQEMARILGSAERLNLDDLYLSTLVGSIKLGIRLRPDLKPGESFHDLERVRRAFGKGDPDPIDLMELRTQVGSSIPHSLLAQIHSLLTQNYYSLADFALAAIEPRRILMDELLEELPELSGYESPAARSGLINAWTREWARSSAGIWLRGMPASWWQGAKENTGVSMQGHASGKFQAITGLLADRSAKKTFESDWAPGLLSKLCERVDSKYRLLGSNVRLETNLQWTYCQACRATHPFEQGIEVCISCRTPHPPIIEPDTDPVFKARKGFYRTPTIEALADSRRAPLTLQAAEHTAQLNSAESTDVFSRAEIYELLFQDVEIPAPDGGASETAIDLLSSTTTMEVGIDIGALSGVALRNMPPSRPSYQQRSGRAGRRGSSIATVVAFGSADSHDDHFFSEPKEMIRGAIEDPSLTLDNSDIAWRHVLAFLLQNYHQERLVDIDESDAVNYGVSLFEVLGKVEGFVDPSSPLNRFDYREWVTSSPDLRSRLDAWLPLEIPDLERNWLLDNFADESCRRIDDALDYRESDPPAPGVESGTDEGDELESESSEVARLVQNDDVPLDQAAISDGLLDRLLYKGVLPRYAFPTDVASFYVFDQEKSTRFKKALKYAPGQSLQVALTQYAPGKEVVIDSKEWVSGALYSVMPNDRFDAWQRRRIYLECSECGYAKTVDGSDSAGHDQDYQLRESYDCPACQTQNSFGKAMNWLRPPGFAHPVDHEVGTVHGDLPAASYATRAKLVESSPVEDSEFMRLAPGLRHAYKRSVLVVSNSGPKDDGYDYCTLCGRIAPSAQLIGNIRGPHNKPTPEEKESVCPGNRVTRNLVLGMDFHADVLLSSLAFERPVRLVPGQLATQIALRTAAEAMVKAGTKILQLDANELAAEFRPALSGGGPSGREAEIYMYDTLSGGAGFTRRLQDEGRRLYEEAIALLMTCPDKCDRSCYRCLRSFGNRFEHDRLDRFMGADLLQHVLTGHVPSLTKQREERALDLLEADLSRRAELSVTRGATVTSAGMPEMQVPLLVERGDKRIVVGIHHPLTPMYLADPNLNELAEFGVDTSVVAVDELVVLRNLPTAARRVLEALRLS